MDEFNLIKILTSKIKYKNKDIIVGVGDDSAVINFNKKEYLLYTTDSLVEDVHFKLSWNIEKTKLYYFLGWKAIAVNISDIFAMRGIPLYALVSLYIPKNFSENELKLIYKGVYAALKFYNAELIGGNVSGNRDKLIIGVTLTGKVNKKKLLLRSTAETGDYIYVEKGVGDSAEGLKLLMKKEFRLNKKILAHLKPTPTINWAEFNNKKINSAIDISDGFLADLNHILQQSKKGAELFFEKDIFTKYFLYGGEDYKIIFASPDIINNRKILCVGKIINTKKIYFIKNKKKHELKNIQGFKHL